MLLEKPTCSGALVSSARMQIRLSEERGTAQKGGEASILPFALSAEKGRLNLQVQSPHQSSNMTGKGFSPLHPATHLNRCDVGTRPNATPLGHLEENDNPSKYVVVEAPLVTDSGASFVRGRSRGANWTGARQFLRWWDARGEPKEANAREALPTRSPEKGRTLLRVSSASASQRVERKLVPLPKRATSIAFSSARN